MKKLSWITVGLTYFLMVWGNTVSATGSGLACPDWPLCHGTLTPAISGPVILEWGHRLLAATAGLFIIATIIQVFRNNSNRSLRRSGKTLLALLVAQILLGGSTVLVGLSPALSTIHLIIATLVFGGLISVACAATWGDPVAGTPSPKIQRLATAGLVALLVQFCLGALIRHNHAGLACPNFPSCLDGFLPIPLTYESVLAFVHRWWGVIMIGLFAHIALTVPKLAPRLAFPARQLLALGVAQVFLGIGTVLSGISVDSRAIHAAVGYALWGLLFYIAIRAGALRILWQEKA